ncbi:MAG: DUF2304 family protein [Candidatus Berkelbacteria bacterium]
MILTIVRIIAIILSLVSITKTYYDLKKHTESITMFIFWLLVWGAVIVAALFPINIMQIAANIGQKGIGIGTFLGLVLVFLLFVIYRVYVKANRIEKQVRDMVMKLGLKDVE